MRINNPKMRSPTRSKACQNKNRGIRHTFMQTTTNPPLKSSSTSSSCVPSFPSHHQLPAFPQVHLFPSLLVPSPSSAFSSSHLSHSTPSLQAQNTHHSPGPCNHYTPSIPGGTSFLPFPRPWRSPNKAPQSHLHTHHSNSHSTYDNPLHNMAHH